MEGFILLHRKIQNGWLWKKPEYLHWFLHILFKANFKDNDKFLFEGKFLSIKRGQFVTSYNELSKELIHCTPKRARNFIQTLIKSETIIYENLKKGARITICNYDSYQNEGHGKGTVGATIERRIKKNNNDNNEKETKALPVFSFKKSFLDLGVEVDILNDWLSVRKAKKSSNTKTAFNALIKQFDKAKDLSVNDCIKIAAEKSWAGFNITWLSDQKNISAKPAKKVRTAQDLRDKLNAKYGEL